MRAPKRHTDRRVASAHCAALSPDRGGGAGGGGYPIQSWTGGLPSSPNGGVPYPDLGWGTPPPIETWDGVCPHPDLGRGTLPPSRCELTNKLKTVPSPILRMRVVNIAKDRYRCLVFKETVPLMSCTGYNGPKKGKTECRKSCRNEITISFAMHWGAIQRYT